jgi:hypothetical protein
MHETPTTSPPPRRRSRRLRITMAFHRWLALPLALFLVLFAASGILLNHRDLVSPLHISRRLLPPEFRFNHWNNAAVKGALPLDGDTQLIYGHVGIWKADNNLSTFQDYSAGLPQGSDRRIVERIFKTTHGDVLAGTRYGMYRLQAGRWTPVPLPTHDSHVVDFAQRADRIYVLTRSHVLSAPEDDLSALQPHPLKPPSSWDGKIPLLRVVWKLHSGELYGLPGRLLVDLLGVAMMVLAISGCWLFFGPKHMRRRKRSGRPVSTLAASTRGHRRWHRRTGIVIVCLLLVSTVTGMLLRPPFLLTIVRSRAKPFPGSALRHAGPWHDRLRRILYEPDGDHFVLATADGIYSFDAAFNNPPQFMRRQPPVSVMGVTVFERIGSGRYLVGSFSGLYFWLPEKSILMDWITKGPPPDRKPRLPFGADMISGYLLDNDSRAYIFDYRRGARPLGHTATFSEMPEGAKNTPMPLWRLALETHTGRIYQSILGRGQLLWVAVSGLLTVFILLSGLLWWLQTRPKKRRPVQ